MSIDVLVADDERPAREELAHLLRTDGRIGDIRTAATGADALRALTERPAGIAFLDIHMPGLSGTELARAVHTLAEPPAIVFVTADDARAVEAFELRAVDYLLKPVRLERLRAAIDRVASRGVAQEDADDEVLAASVGNVVRFIRKHDVRWVQAQGDYSRVHADDGVGLLVRVPISELDQRWPDFVRVHRSYLVRAAVVTEMRLTGGEPQVSVGEIVLPVSRRLVPAVREALGARSTS